MMYQPLESLRFTLMALLLLSSISLLTACSRPMPDLDLTPQVNQLFSALQANDIDAALAMYSDEFFKGIPEPAWRSKLQKFNEHMGTMESIRIRTKQSDTRYSGKFFIFKIETVHKDNKKARHILTYVLPIDDSGIKLVGHKITAKGF